MPTDFTPMTPDERDADPAYRSMRSALHRWLDDLPSCPERGVRILADYDDGWEFDLDLHDGVVVDAFDEINPARWLGPGRRSTRAENRARWQGWVARHVDRLAAALMTDSMADSWLDDLVGRSAGHARQPAGIRLH